MIQVGTLKRKIGSNTNAFDESVSSKKEFQRETRILTHDQHCFPSSANNLYQNSCIRSHYEESASIGDSSSKRYVSEIIFNVNRKFSTTEETFLNEVHFVNKPISSAEISNKELIHSPMDLLHSLSSDKGSEPRNPSITDAKDVAECVPPCPKERHLYNVLIPIRTESKINVISNDATMFSSHDALNIVESRRNLTPDMNSSLISSNSMQEMLQDTSLLNFGHLLKDPQCYLHCDAEAADSTSIAISSSATSNDSGVINRQKVPSLIDMDHESTEEDRRRPSSSRLISQGTQVSGPSFDLSYKNATVQTVSVLDSLKEYGNIENAEMSTVEPQEQIIIILPITTVTQQYEKSDPEESWQKNVNSLKEINFETCDPSKGDQGASKQILNNFGKNKALQKDSKHRTISKPEEICIAAQKSATVAVVDDPDNHTEPFIEKYVTPIRNGRGSMKIDSPKLADHSDVSNNKFHIPTKVASPINSHYNFSSRYEKDETTNVNFQPVEKLCYYGDCIKQSKAIHEKSFGSEYIQCAACDQCDDISRNISPSSPEECSFCSSCILCVLEKPLNETNNVPLTVNRRNPPPVSKIPINCSSPGLENDPENKNTLTNLTNYFFKKLYKKINLFESRNGAIDYDENESTVYCSKENSEMKPIRKELLISGDLEMEATTRPIEISKKEVSNDKTSLESDLVERKVDLLTVIGDRQKRLSVQKWILDQMTLNIARRTEERCFGDNIKKRYKYGHISQPIANSDAANIISTSEAPEKSPNQRSNKVENSTTLKNIKNCSRKSTLQGKSGDQDYRHRSISCMANNIDKMKCTDTFINHVDGITTHANHLRSSKSSMNCETKENGKEILVNGKSIYTKLSKSKLECLSVNIGKNEGIKSPDTIIGVGALKSKRLRYSRILEAESSGSGEYFPPHGFPYEHIFGLPAFDDLIKSHLNFADRRIKSVALKTECFIAIMGPFRNEVSMNSSGNSMRYMEKFKMVIASSSWDRIRNCLAHLKKTFPRTCLKKTLKISNIE